eukprot:1160740-Pelagomonas_calceolata.AAC.2
MRELGKDSEACTQRAGCAAARVFGTSFVNWQGQLDARSVETHSERRGVALDAVDFGCPVEIVKPNLGGPTFSRSRPLCFLSKGRNRERWHRLCLSRRATF